MIKWETGEIQIHNRLAKWQYFRNTTAAAGAFTPDSWMRTGDIRYTEDKNWYIFDHAKDLIKLVVGKSAQLRSKWL